MHKQLLFFAILFGIVLTSSCKKKVRLQFDDNIQVTGEKSYDVIPSPADSVIVNFKYLQGKMRATAVLNGSTQSFNAIMRWEKGQKIWMSMSLFGIEGVRALIDSTGIQWIDRMNGEYHFLPMSKIASKINMDLDFPAIERIMLGLPAIVDQLPAEITTSDQWLQWQTHHLNGYNSTAIFNRINNMLIEYKAKNHLQQRNLTAKYGEFQNVGKGWFAFDRFIQISEANSFFELQAKFSDVTILDELSFPFEVSDKYKKISY